MNLSRTRRAVACAALLALTAGGTLAAGPTAGAADAAAAAEVTDRQAAQDALASVRAVFQRAPRAQARTTLDEGGVEATLALRDLARYAGSLDADQRAEATAYLSRPTSDDGDEIAGFAVRYGVPEAPAACTSDLCVHYVTTTDDAPALTDVDDATGAPGANGIPDYVDTVLRVMTEVHDTYVEAGYREPRGDGALGGGDDLIDVYLAEIGAAGLYGYCTTDQPDPRGGPPSYDRWAHCVLDDDYAGFPNTALENIQVTAAHEYFHATQYAYDAFEDAWFLEATATWAEDEVFDGVDDNVQYLRRSPLTAPFVPLDSFIGGGKYAGFHYGTWSFFRFLTEKYGATQGSMPRLVLDLMEHVDGSLGARDQYSWQALETVLRAERTTAARQFLAYSVANRRPRETYAEGRAQKYPTGPLEGSITLKPKKRRAGVTTTTTDHLTSATYRITSRHLRQRSTRLRLDLDLARRSRGSMAALTVVPRRGPVTTSRIKLDRSGAGRTKVAFSSRRVKYVELTLANASARFARCYQYATPYSCSGGTPLDDGLEQRFSARLVR